MLSWDDYETEQSGGNEAVVNQKVLEKQEIFVENTLNYSKIRTRNTQSILQKHQNSNETNLDIFKFQNY